MAQETRSVLKGHFLTGAKPTQQQFHNVFDSFQHKDDVIPAANVEGLGPVTVNVSSADTYAITAGKLLEYIVIETTVSSLVKIGNSAGSNDIHEVTVAPATPLVIQYLTYYASAHTLHFTGNATIKLYIR